jgi:hypothetical protein
MKLVVRDGVCHPDLAGLAPALLDDYAALCARYGVTMDDEMQSTDRYLELMRQLYAGLKAVQLENAHWRVIVLPESNGKVVEMTYKPTGRNVVRAPRGFNRFRYEEWVRQGEGPRSESILAFDARADPDRVRLSLVTADGTTLDRRIALVGDAVRFETEVTAAAARPFELQVHPEYDTATMSTDPAVLGIYVRQPEWRQVNRPWKDGLSPAQQRTIVHDAVAGGAYAYFNWQAGFGVEQRFDPQAFGALGLFWDASRQQINLELSTPAVTLGKGERTRSAYEVRYLHKAPQTSRSRTARPTREQAP